MVKIIVPPEIGTLISLKVDNVTRNVQFDQQPLQAVLRKFREYIRELHERGLTDMHTELETQIQCTRQELTVLINEKAQETESHVLEKMDEVQELVESVKSTLVKFEARIDRLGDRVQKAEGMAVEAAKFAAPRAEHGDGQATEAAPRLESHVPELEARSSIRVRRASHESEQSGTETSRRFAAGFAELLEGKPTEVPTTLPVESW